MPVRTVKLLHIEDDRAPRFLVARFLSQMEGLTFDIAAAESEDEAVAAFERGGVEFVLLDYELSEGNGLSCLRKLRARDPLVPIIALSAASSAEVVEDLLQAGADDFIPKAQLRAEVLTRAVADSLTRADAWRRHSSPRPLSLVDEMLRDVCQRFVALGPDFFARLDALEEVARQSKSPEAQLKRSFEAVCQQLDTAAPQGALPARRRLRPVLLELLVRLAGEAGL